VLKTDDERRMIFGWAYVSEIDGRQIVDKQDDMAPIEEIEKAAYDFNLYARSQGDMHERKDVGRLVESFVFTAEKEQLGIVAKNEEGDVIYGWWTGFKVDDDAVWKAHKSGKRPELSIGGRATKVAA